MASFTNLCHSIADLRQLIGYHDSYLPFVQYFTVVVSIVTCLVGLVGNALVICFLGFVMKKHKSKYWFLNLAIADFFSLLTLPFHAIAAFKGTWPFGDQVCKLFIFSMTANMNASIFILTSLNIARVLSVAQPMFHLKFISKRVSFWICSIIWLLAIPSTLPVFYYSGEMKIGEFVLCTYHGSKTLETAVAKIRYNVSSGNATRDVSDIYAMFGSYFKQCSSHACCGGEEALSFWDHVRSTSNQLVIPFLVIGYFIPLSIVIICNIIIVVHVRKSKTINTHRLYRMVVAIIVVYFITWTPVVIAETALFVVILKKNFLAMFCILQFMPLFISIAYTNNCLNPIFYVLNGGQMRMKLCDFISSFRNSKK
ncbi:C5a anaphylatoxin chemotactic receptor 1-like [Bufo gargarizans]|uniref:C5a anaphylatoxin chemotactic receptor 1-like n=1 Tax=Bufo gargarizans TaxID=30331 RepID=UPI001CF10DF6|nr:C5a anaphylatoxin chemotactic receptor 1-like [Bufo gargarizans]